MNKWTNEHGNEGTLTIYTSHISKVFKGMPKYPKVCTLRRKYLKRCKTKEKYDKIYKSMRWHAKIFRKNVNS